MGLGGPETPLFGRIVRKLRNPMGMGGLTHTIRSSLGCRPKETDPSPTDVHFNAQVFAPEWIHEHLKVVQ